MKYVTRGALNFLAALIVGECIVSAISAQRRAEFFSLPEGRLFDRNVVWRHSPRCRHIFVPRPPDPTIPPDTTGPLRKGGKEARANGMFPAVP